MILSSGDSEFNFFSEASSKYLKLGTDVLIHAYLLKHTVYLILMWTCGTLLAKCEDSNILSPKDYFRSALKPPNLIGGEGGSEK